MSADVGFVDVGFVTRSGKSQRRPSGGCFQCRDPGFETGDDVGELRRELTHHEQDHGCDRFELVFGGLASAAVQSVVQALSDAMFVHESEIVGGRRGCSSAPSELAGGAAPGPDHPHDGRTQASEVTPMSPTDGHGDAPTGCHAAKFFSTLRGMNLGESDLAFLNEQHSAAMITVATDGAAKAARVGIALVDGQLWSSGTEGRIRTRRLRRDPRCTLYVHAAGFAWLALETTVTILDGSDAPQQNLRLFRVMQNKPDGPLSWFGGELSEEAFLRTMVDEQRLIYQFDIHRAYGLH